MKRERNTQERNLGWPGWPWLPKSPRFGVTAKEFRSDGYGTFVSARGGDAGEVAWRVGDAVGLNGDAALLVYRRADWSVLSGVHRSLPSGQEGKVVGC